VQLVLCASSPDTKEIGLETSAGVDQLRAERGDSSVIWVQEQVVRFLRTGRFDHAGATIRGNP